MDILYRVDIQPNQLVVFIEEKGSKRLLYLDTLKKGASEKDRPALSFLAKIHLRSPHVSRSLDTVVLQKVEVSASEAQEALRLMSLTGNLMYQGKPLSVDLQKKAKLYFRGEKHTDRACTVRAYLQLSVEEIPLESCEKMFPGMWFLKEGKIFGLETQLAWKWVELFAKGAVRLEGAVWKKFLDEEPPILWKEAPSPLALEVFPRLVLSDATGSFANLWMDYSTGGSIAYEDLSPLIQGKSRLKEAELHWEKDLLETGFVRKGVGASRYYCVSDRARQALLFLLEMGWKLEDVKGRQIHRQTGFSLHIQDEGAQIALRGSAQFGSHSGPLKKTVEAQQRGNLWVDLGPESVGLLDPAHALDRMEGEWKEESELLLSKAQAVHLRSLLEDPQVQWEASIKKAIEGLQEGHCFEASSVGPSFQGQLLPYQQKGLDWMCSLYRWGFSGLLADEMGLGKTVQVLAFFSQLRTNLPVLVVAPTSLLFNWAAEIRRFLPDWDVLIHAGPNRCKAREELQKKRCILTSYAILRSDEELLKEILFEVIVLDESNAIKTCTTQTAQAAYRLQGRFKLALSGTPIENRLEELYSQFRFLMPSLLGTSPVQASLPLIKRKVRPFLLRRKKEEVQIELPEKIEQIVWIEMEPEQAKVYESYRLQLKEGLLKKIEREGVQAHRMEVLEAILRLRQICCDPRLVGSSCAGAKVAQLLEEVDILLQEQRKVLIYSQFTSLLQLICKELHQKGIQPLYLDGSTSLEKRGEFVRTFQESPEPQAFLLSLKAGGVGLNLTAADTVLLLDPWWNEAVEKQAIDRAHRIGQKKTVFAKRYLTPQTLEEKMLELKRKKSLTAQQLLDSEEMERGWTEEDFLLLLEP